MVPVLGGVQVEHEADERALEARPGALHEDEAGPRDLHGPLEVDHVQLLGHVPVGQGGEVEGGDGTVRANLDVVGIGVALGDRLVRHVGDDLEGLVAISLGGGHLAFHALDAVAQFTHLRHDGRHVLTGLLALRNALGDAILLGFQSFHLGQGLAAALVCFEHAVHDGGVGAASGELIPDLVGLGADEGEVEHLRGTALSGEC